uniref:Uncharacterized protein n=1 Tax=Vitis vinifera TaxID=29760 RepID=A5B3V5_VITVI|nr:hypothetical protein VITISV_008709 [Vitis vinifera]
MEKKMKSRGGSIGDEEREIVTYLEMNKRDTPEKMLYDWSSSEKMLCDWSSPEVEHSIAASASTTRASSSRSVKGEIKACLRHTSLKRRTPFSR